MCNGLVFQRWQARCLEELAAVPSVEITLVIVNAGSRSARAGEAGPGPARGSLRRRVATLAALRDRLRVAGLSLFYRMYFNKRAKCATPVDMSPLLGLVPIMRCTVERRGRWSEHFDQDAVAAIRERNLDVLIRFGFGIIRGDILSAARYGVWSFHHDDERKYRGGPPAFWEIYYGDPISGAILQRLTDRLDGGVVLHRGYFRTASHSYVTNMDAVKMGSAEWPARVCRDILSGAACYIDNPPSLSNAPIYRSPTNMQLARFVARCVRSYLLLQWRTLLWHDDWHIGIVDAPITAFLNPRGLPPVRWLPRRSRDGFLADPFALEHDGELVVLAERFEQRSQRGRIVAVRDAASPSPREEVALDLPVHLSYPFLYRENATIYCIPEMADALELALFRAIEFPSRWERVGTILEGIGAIDPTIFRHDGRLWLLCGDRWAGSNTKLFGWWADRICGPWTPHAANPLKTDVRGARPAGRPFLHEGQLYRPAQDNSRTYGGSVVIHRVVALTPNLFREEPVAVIPPIGRGYSDGIHTLTGVGGLTVVDGKRRLFDPAGLPRRLRQKAAKAFGS